MLDTCVSAVGSAILLALRATRRMHPARSFFRSVGIMESKKRLDLSDVAKIEEDLEHPVELFRVWHDEAKKFHSRAPDACCLATVSKDCRVSARNVLLREFDNDGFVIVTDSRSKKVSNIEDVPDVAMCYLWVYENEKKQAIVKQVRVEGTMKCLEREDFRHLYDKEPLYCKIRSHLCDQGRDVNWNDLKQRHDQILDSVRKTQNDLPMPDHFVGYKLFPTMMEFYFARDHLIGDRILYERNATNDVWEHRRIAA